MGFIAIAFLADGYADPYYLRLTSAQQTALIVGSSRAAQGLQPSVINQALAQEYGHAIYNFSFSASYSPFGKTYLDAIRKKLRSDTKNSFFIVAVDPWSLIADKPSPEDPATFPESWCMLGHNPWINSKPCFIYLAKDYPVPYMTLVTGAIHRRLLHFRPAFQLHDNGWLEVPAPIDSTRMKGAMQSTLAMYTRYRDAKTMSHTRLSALVETIGFLRQHGDVYLVRLPAHPEILAIENQVCPGFNEVIDSIARTHHTPYFSFIDSCTKYTYTDGTHLWKGSGALVSEELSRLILNYRHSR
jgi:hypothetical protein